MRNDGRSAGERAGRTKDRVLSKLRKENHAVRRAKTSLLQPTQECEPAQHARGAVTDGLSPLKRKHVARHGDDRMKPVGAQAAGCEKQIAFRLCQGGRRVVSNENRRRRTFKLAQFAFASHGRGASRSSVARGPQTMTRSRPAACGLDMCQERGEMGQPASALQVRRIDPDPHLCLNNRPVAAFSAGW